MLVLFRKRKEKQKKTYLPQGETTPQAHHHPLFIRGPLLFGRGPFIGGPCRSLVVRRWSSRLSFIHSVPHCVSVSTHWGPCDQSLTAVVGAGFLIVVASSFVFVHSSYLRRSVPLSSRAYPQGVLGSVVHCRCLQGRL